MKTMFYLFFLFFFAGCKLIAKTTFHTGRPFIFKTKQGYEQHLENKKVLSSFEQLYVDSIFYVNFLSSISAPDGSLVYQGCYLNDSVVIKTSNTFNQKKYCPGLIFTEINNLINKNILFDSTKPADLILSHFMFRDLKEGRIFPVDHSSQKLKIVLTYSYAFGKYYDQLFAEIKSLLQKNKQQLDVFLISIDPVYQLR
jgi:hypothetical protein